MNIQKQIDYWSDSAKDDLLTAELLINNNRVLHGLFWCHLIIEKTLKAHVVKDTHQVPPKTHNLIWLLEKTNIMLTPETISLIGLLMIYQLEGRYPENYPIAPSKTFAFDTFVKTKNLHEWLINKL